MVNNPYAYSFYYWDGFLDSMSCNSYTRDNMRKYYATRDEAYFRNMNTMATAVIKGGPFAPSIKGMVYFVDVPYGTNVCVTVWGLPEFKPATANEKQIGPHGFHIHEFGNCEVGDVNDPFKSAGSHWNPTKQPHGNHAGDFPVLFSNHGIAMMCFFTDKFKVKDVIGKSVVIHESPDDYKTQPAGDSGRRLACGVIK